MLKKSINKTIYGFLLILLSYPSSGQEVNLLTITSPPSITGDYQISQATFGGQGAIGLAGVGLFVDDGIDPTTDACDGTITNVPGRFAFIDRGTCEFGFKALAAQNAGAVIVVICNGIGTTGPLLNMPPGNYGNMVNRPVYSMSYDDCQIIKSKGINNEFEIELRTACISENSSEIIWGGNTGEGDFNGGLNDWIVECDQDSCWQWKENGFAPGAFTNDFIQSSTVCNGAMVFTSDYLDNGGSWVGNSIGSGAGGCVAPCFGTLRSPTIDLSGFQLEAFFLEFHQRYRHFTETESKVLLSKNGGVTWTDTILLNTQAVVNGPPIDETIRIPLIGYTGVNSLTIQFEHTGNYYFWTIDDVKLINLPGFVNTELNTDFYAPPAQWTTPMGQKLEFPFVVSVENNGNEPAEDVELSVEIKNNAGTIVYSQLEELNNLEGHSKLENHIIPDLFSESLPMGFYEGSYIVNSTGNITSENDSIHFSFKITEDYYSCAPNQNEIDELGLEEMEPITEISQNTGLPVLFYATGTAFFNEVEGNSLDHVRFGITEELEEAGGFIRLRLYELPDGDSNLDSKISADERILVGSNMKSIDKSENLEVIDMPIWLYLDNQNQSGSVVELKENTNYLVVFIVQPSEGNQIDLLSYPSTKNEFLQTRTSNWHHGVAREAFINTGNTRAIGTYLVPLIDGTSEDFDTTNLNAFNDNTLYSEIYISQTSSIKEEIQSDEVFIYPNPAKDLLTISLNEVFSDPSFIQLIDINGKVQFTDTFNTNSHSISTENLNSGTYLIRISSGKKSIIQKVLILK